MGDGVLGRDAELGVIDQAVADLGMGPLGLVIAGDAGIGKTTLWEAARRSAVAVSYRVLTARPAEAERSLSYAGIADLLETFAEHVVSNLPELQRRAIEVAMLGATDSAGRPVDQRTVAVAVLGALRALAEEGPVVVAVDDLQWLDAASLRVLQFAARRLGPMPVGFFLSVRAPPSSVDLLELRRALPADRFFLVRVGPLGVGALRQVMTDRLGTHVSSSFAGGLHRATAGNPFYAIELARSLVDQVTNLKPGHPLPVPEDLRSLVRGHLQSLPAAAQEAVLVIAAAHQPSVELVGAVLGTGGADGLALAQAAGMVEADGDRVRLAHPLLGSTAYAEIRPERRRHLHRSLARVLREPAERAYHLALTCSGPDAEVAARLEAEALATARRGAPEGAAQLAEQAIMLTPVPGGVDQWRRMRAAASYHLSHGDRSRARSLLDDVVDQSPPGPARAQALRLLGELRYNDDSLSDAIPLLRQALVEAGSKPHIAGPIELDLAFTLVHTGNFAEGPPHAHAALTWAERLGEPDLLGQALAVAVVADVQIGLGLDETRLQRALALEEPSAPSVLWMRPSLIAPLLWLWTGRLDEARRGFASLHQNLAQRGEEESIPASAMFATQVECWSGDLLAAKAQADAGTTAADVGGGRLAQAFAKTGQALFHAHVGDVEATRHEASDAAAAFLGSGFPMHVVWPAWALGLAELSLGDLAAVHRAVGPIAEAVSASGLKEPGACPMIPDEIEALIGLGRLAEAGELLTRFHENACSLDRAWGLATAARCRGMLLAATGDLEGAEKSVDFALVQHQRIPMPIERARTLLVRGQLRRRRKKKSEAKDALAQATAVFEDAGALLWANRARQELARVGLRPAAPTALTATESQVAELAATGLTTKAIAEQMFLSAKTVESVLARIYRKLDVHSRAGLATKMSKDPGAFLMVRSGEREPPVRTRKS